METKSGGSYFIDWRWRWIILVIVSGEGQREKNAFSTGWEEKNEVYILRGRGAGGVSFLQPLRQQLGDRSGAGGTS
jgi:hypothetical protein